MSKKEELLEQLGESFGYVEQAVDSRIELAKIRLAENASVILSSIASTAVLGLLLVFALFCLTVAGGFALVAIVGSPVLAFSVMAGIFVLIGGIVVFFRKPLIVDPISSLVIHQLFSEDE